MEKQNITTFGEAVSYLYAVPRFTSKNTMEDTKEYLHRLGDPDRRMHIIHVAGTNGKGSVCAYMRYILEAAGYKVALFTSPHLVDIRERFLVKGKMVSEEAFLKAFLQIYEGLDWEELARGKGYHPTFFEYLFFMAMILFDREDIDYCILETGLGGRLDATNAVSRKELSVITRINLDHVEYLGSTIAQIAGEKAGIMKEGVPLVFSDVEPEATRVFTKQGANLGSMLYPVSRNDYAFLNFNNKNIDFSLHTEYYGYIRLTLHTIARYQMENAALAVRAIEVLDKARTITAQAIAKGVGACVWQGRMEELLPEVYVDGAHNDDGIRAFLETVSQDGVEGGRTLLFSVVQDKDYRHMIERITSSGLFCKIAVAHMHTGRAADLESMRQLFIQKGKAAGCLDAQHTGADCDNRENAQTQVSCQCTAYDSVQDAFRALLKNKRQGERIYIAGSLYLVGELKEALMDNIEGI